MLKSLVLHISDHVRELIQSLKITTDQAVQIATIKDEERQKQEQQEKALEAVREDPGKVEQLLAKQKKLMEAIRRIDPGKIQQLVEKAEENQ